MRAIVVVLLLSAGLSSARNLGEQIKSLVEKQIEQKKAVGVSVAVGKGDEILFTGGFGRADRDDDIEADRNTVYRIGSITKQFTAAAILLLEKDGKLNLDDRLDQHVKGFPTEQKITLRHLLSHTSGIKSFTSLPSYGLLMGVKVSHEDILGRFRDLPLEFDPGSKYRYSNSGYYLLGMVIEKVSGVTYEEFLQKRVFAQLKMKSSGYERADKPMPNMATGYRLWLGGVWPAKAQHMSQPFSAGALISSVEDLLRWQRGLVNGSLLPRPAYRRMATKAQLSNGKSSGYGLGIRVSRWKGRRMFHHGGGISGFRSELLYLPDSGHTVVVLANCGQTNAGKIAQAIVELLPKAP